MLLNKATDSHFNLRLLSAMEEAMKKLLVKDVYNQKQTVALIV